VKGIGSKFESSTDVDYKGPREKTICEMPQDYEASAVNAQRAKAEFKHLLASSARAAATGDATANRVASTGMRASGTPSADTSGLVKTFPRARTLGGAYCRMLSVFDVKKAKADPAPLGVSFTAAPQAVGGGSPSQKARERAIIERQRASQDSQARASVTAQRPPADEPTMSMPPGGFAPSAGFNGGSSVIESIQQRLVESERTRDMYLVEIHKKFALAVACIVFVLIGAPIALRFPRGGVGLVISVSLGVFALYYVGLIAGQSLAEHGTLNPFWSMWMANIIFAVVGLLLLSRMGKEQGSSRSGGDLKEMIEVMRVWLFGWLRRFGFKVDRRRRVA
jgi:lipopolysaccharide export system permease protein